LAASAYLAQSGYDVTVFEKNDAIGGRARQLKKDGFTLIWDQVGTGCQTFLRFFADFGKKTTDY
jgi:phytoene desaturase